MKVAMIVFLWMAAGGLVLFSLSFQSKNLPNEENLSMELLNPPQQKLYHFLRSKGYKVEVFQPCGRYTIEMALPQYRIAIECPGKVVPFPSYEDRAYSKKDLYLANRGWLTLRFSSAMINHHPHHVLKRIEDKILESQVP